MSVQYFKTKTEVTITDNDDNPVHTLPIECIGTSDRLWVFFEGSNNGKSNGYALSLSEIMRNTEEFEEITKEEYDQIKQENTTTPSRILRL